MGDKFYDFWFSFKSWRDFSHLDEHKLDDAGSRDEKRWMERQNQKLRAAKKKEETARIRKLVEDAMKKDPRIIAQKKKEEERRNKIKQEKAEKKRLRDLEKQKEKEREQKKIDDEKKRKKEEKDKKRRLVKLLKKTRSNFRKLATSGKVGKFDSQDVELLCQNLQLDDMSDLATAFSVQNNVTISDEKKKKSI